MSVFVIFFKHPASICTTSTFFVWSSNSAISFYATSQTISSPYKENAVSTALSHLFLQILILCIQPVPYEFPAAIMRTRSQASTPEIGTLVSAVEWNFMKQLYQFFFAHCFYTFNIFHFFPFFQNLNQVSVAFRRGFT